MPGLPLLQILALYRAVSGTIFIGLSILTRTLPLRVFGMAAAFAVTAAASLHVLIGFTVQL